MHRLLGAILFYIKISKFNITSWLRQPPPRQICIHWFSASAAGNRRHTGHTGSSVWVQRQSTHTKHKHKHMHNLGQTQTQRTTRSKQKEPNTLEKLGNGCMKKQARPFQKLAKEHFHIHLCTCSQILTLRTPGVTCWIKETIPQCSRENTAALRPGQSEWITEMLKERRESIINRGRWRCTSAPYA